MDNFLRYRVNIECCAKDFVRIELFLCIFLMCLSLSLSGPVYFYFINIGYLIVLKNIPRLRCVPGNHYERQCRDDDNFESLTLLKDF